MKLTEHEIESWLRHAPAPEPPGGLRDRLVDGINLNSRSQVFTRDNPSTGFWRRWWPVLTPGAVSVACAVVLSLQQFEINQLKETISALPAQTQESAGLASPAPGTSSDSSFDEAKEIERLQAEVARLRETVAAGEALLLQNQQLRTQLAAPVAGLTQDELQALQAAREKAMAITCVNNLKQVGLAARIWAVDHKDTFPPSMADMSKELTTPKILVCPADSQHQVAADWSSFTPANCSYEYLLPNGSTTTRPNVVVFRCAIHGSLGLADGSVQMGIAKSHPEWLVQKDGNLEMVVPQAPGQGNP